MSDGQVKTQEKCTGPQEALRSPDSGYGCES
jgi:hypothetical protein